ncbi:MAG TPA: SGNH/GDSL hydrolase family protein [archaeon]|nr:SGNH/GDSL hydrolase family protein [archaeon]
MLSKRLLHGIVLALLVSVSVSFAQEPGFFIQDSDVVLIWGNSITDYGVYPRLIENYVLTHYPDWKVEFFNLGWGGDVTKNVDRLRRDIQLCKPTKATVMLGMNDGGYGPFDPERLEAYLKGMKDEVELMRRHSSPEIMLISATPYDLSCRPDLVRGKVEKPEDLRTLLYPETLRRFSYELGRFATREGLRFVDLNYASSMVIDELKGYDGNFMFTKEGVHANVDGELQMGLAILEGMQAFSLVAEVEICVKENKVKLEKDCTVSDFKASPTAVSFTRKDLRLPTPVYPSTRALMLKVMDYPDAWDRDILRINHLDQGWYKLSIDGREIDILSSTEFEKGVNLSSYGNTPQMIQAYQVFEQTEIRHQAFYTKWRQVLLEGVGSPRDFTPFKTGVSTENLDRAEREAFAAQHRLNKPVPHSYVIKQVPNPAPKPSDSVPAGQFLENMVRVLISIDSRTLPEFEPPLCVRGNFSYTPRYRWAILERKGYYADIPVVLYDNGTHGDLAAGDGVWSLEMFVRKDSGKLRFIVRDGRFLTGYWNYLHYEYFNNPYCREITRTWGEMLGPGHLDKDGEIVGIDLNKNIELKWDLAAFQKALKEKKIYQP